MPDYISVASFINKYQSTFLKATAYIGVTVPKNNREYFNYRSKDPNDKTQHISVNEYNELLQIIQDGEKSSNGLVRAQATEYRIMLAALEHMSDNIVYGDVTAKDAQDKLFRDLVNNEYECLDKLEQLENASISQKIKNFFTGELDEERAKLIVEMEQYTNLQNRYDAKIVYDAIQQYQSNKRIQK